MTTRGNDGWIAVVADSAAPLAAGSRSGRLRRGGGQLVATVVAWLARCRPGRRALGRQAEAPTERRRDAAETGPSFASLRASMVGADAVTGLPTRVDLSRIVQALALLPANGEVELCVLCLDLDDFRAVNLRHGRAAGDSALRQIGARLRAAARDADIVLRLGGDEFVVIAACPAGMGGKTTALIATRLLAEMQRPLPGIGASGLALGACIGTARWRPGRALLLESVAQAEEALLAAKRAGRCQLRHYASRQRLRPRRSEAAARPS